MSLEETGLLPEAQVLQDQIELPTMADHLQVVQDIRVL